MKKILAVVSALICGMIVMSCSNDVATLENSSMASASRTVVSGTNGSVTVNNMTGGNMTVTYNAGSQLNYARLFVSEGNGAGLILANKDMDYSNGVYSYTVNHSTFTSGAKIYFTVLVNNSGVEKCMPQGTLSSTTSWSSVTYGTDTSTGSSSSDSSSESSGVVTGTNGSVTVDNMTSGNMTLTYNAGSQLNYARLFVSEGNGTGLILANKDMDYSNGVYSYTVNHSTFTSGAKIYFTVLANNSGVEKCIPQGTLADTTSWSSVTYGSTTSSGSTDSGSGSTDSGSSSDDVNTDYNLVTLNSGYEMTFQFANNTNGSYADSDIYICCLGRDSSSNFCYLKPDGTLQRITSGSSSSDWSYKLSDLSSGMQVPKTFSSGRLYISMGKPVVMSGITDGAGAVGVVQPDLNNPADANVNTIFDWIEFTVTNGGFWGNTTQVDQFGFPVTMAMYNDSGYYRTVGITESRDAIFNEFKSEVPAEYQTLIQSPYRIIAPCKGEFRTGRTYGTYMDSYVNEVWSYYASNTKSVEHPLGKFNLYASGDNLVFYCTSGYGTAVTGQSYYISGKPDNSALFEGSGVLSTGNTVELALQAQMCAALNRHVATDPSQWASSSSYYGSSPCNNYAKFWHNHSIDAKAYGFCYDDVAEQSSIIETYSPRGLVIGIGF